MAQLTITVPDAVIPRIRTAMGHKDSNGQWVDATLGEVQTAIKGYIKSQVINYETTQAATVKSTEVSQEIW